LSVLRLVAGLLFVEHGSSKLLHFPQVDMFNDLQIMSLIGVAGILELVGGALLALGLFTRPIAFILSGEMAAAYFMAHAPKSFYPVLNGGEGAILFCFIFLYLAAAGGGEWSLDRMLRPGAKI
jgi:putative oxidoreductase